MYSFLKKWAIPGPFFVYFRLFKQTLQFLQQIYVKNAHLVSIAGIQPPDLQSMSLSSHNHLTSASQQAESIEFTRTIQIVNVICFNKTKPKMTL